MQTNITELLDRSSAGDETARDQLIPLVYGELRRLSRSALRRQGRESLLQPTALVHEAWLRMAATSVFPLRTAANSTDSLRK